VELFQADGTAAAISILTDFLRTNVYLWLASLEGVPADISAPRTMTHEDDHFPLHPVNEHALLFQVIGLYLETLESWNGHTICLETDKKLADLLKPPPQQETVEDGAFTGSLDRQPTISTIESERLSPTARGGQERVREGISPKSEDSLVDHEGVITKGSSGRGEDVMHVVKPVLPETVLEPEAEFQFDDFDDPPLHGQEPEELEGEFGIKVEILDDKPDEWLGAYAIRVSGPSAGVQAYLTKYHSSHAAGRPSKNK
jgi:hypothetical protein